MLAAQPVLSDVGLPSVDEASSAAIGSPALAPKEGSITVSAETTQDEQQQPQASGSPGYSALLAMKIPSGPIGDDVPAAAAVAAAAAVDPIPTIESPLSSESSSTASGGFVATEEGKPRPSSEKPSDPFGLIRRFISTQQHYFPQALAEIKAGHKCSCWSWYIFPTPPWVVHGVERGSWTNRDYALRDLPPHDLRGDDATRAFLRFPTYRGINLRDNYVTMMREVGRQLRKGLSTIELVGGLDAPKLKSSLEHFTKIAAEDGFDEEVSAVCREALEAMAVRDQEEAARREAMWRRYDDRRHDGATPAEAMRMLNGPSALAPPPSLPPPSAAATAAVSINTNKLAYQSSSTATSASSWTASRQNDDGEGDDAAVPVAEAADAAAVPATATILDSAGGSSGAATALLIAGDRDDVAEPSSVERRHDVDGLEGASEAL